MTSNERKALAVLLERLAANAQKQREAGQTYWCITPVDEEVLRTAAKALRETATVESETEPQCEYEYDPCISAEGIEYFCDVCRLNPTVVAARRDVADRYKQLTGIELGT